MIADEDLQKAFQSRPRTGQVAMMPLPPETADKVLWMALRQACLLVAAAVEKRYNLGK